jgi:glycosyltransferase involved in cell wall biosynthesis
MPSIDVCMPAYNAGRFIDAAVHSVLAQSHRDFHLIIVDDGSTDDTWQKLQALSAQDSRIRICRNEANTGIANARNQLLALSNAPLIAMADADDFCLPNRFARQLEVLHGDTSIGVVGSAVRIRGSGTPGSVSAFRSKPELIRFFLMFGPCVWNTTTVYRREVIDAVGGYSNAFAKGAEDYELWARLSGITRFVNLEEPLVQVTVHSHSLTADRREVDANIFRVSADLISNYLQRRVSEADARHLHVLLHSGGLASHDCQDALSLLKLIVAVAEKRETADVRSELLSWIAPALWTQAKYHVYSCRPLSLELAAFAARSKPASSLRNVLWFCPRMITPRVIRAAMARAFRRHQPSGVTRE